MFSSPLRCLSGPPSGQDEDWWELKRTRWSELVKERKTRANKTRRVGLEDWTGCSKVQRSHSGGFNKRFDWERGREVERPAVAFLRCQWAILSASVCDTDDPDARWKRSKWQLPRQVVFALSAEFNNTYKTGRLMKPDSSLRRIPLSCGTEILTQKDHKGLKLTRGSYTLKNESSRFPSCS